MTASNQSRLLRLMNRLKNNIEKGENLRFQIPEMWNTFNYDNGKSVKDENGEIYVNPYDFYFECINSAILPNYRSNVDYSKALSYIKGFSEQHGRYMGGDWIKGSTVYGMQIRTTTSWDHDGNGELELKNKQGIRETGTFLKTLALLPALQRMGVNAVYLLPVSKNSMKYRKGEMGSPYAVKNFFEIDPNLKDPMVGEDFSIEDEFGAFVEACHLMDIRVMIDIIPRTSARDSDLIFGHPDWFYWIRKGELGNYAPPRVTAVPALCQPTEENLSLVYVDESVKNHLEMFCSSPDRLNPKKWDEIRNRCLNDENLDFFELIENEMGITTAPAFSDCINDPQPAWSDVTYLKLYMDYPDEAKKYAARNQEPYILFDIIKANRFQGKKPNTELWNIIADIIPSYQRRFGIDGARIDMGHALPGQLEKAILSIPRAIDPDFCFIAEVLGNDGVEAARSSGYNMIIGNSWWSQPRLGEGCFHQTLRELPELKAPIFVCSEAPDTPRTVTRQGGKKLSRLSAVLNYFVPNGVPFITSGFEICEKQPMNMGLDVIPELQFILPESDPYYGKLAFFDKYQLHWDNPDRGEIAGILERAARIRKEFLNDITDVSKYVSLSLRDSDKAIVTAFKISSRPERSLMIAVANADFEKRHSFKLELPSQATAKYCQVLYSEREDTEGLIRLETNRSLELELGPGEIVVFVV